MSRSSAAWPCMLFLSWLPSCSQPVDLSAIPSPSPVACVLTFDDGPLPADAQLPLENLTTDRLLAPLRQILGTLAAGDVQAVFFVKCPPAGTAVDSVGGRNPGQILDAFATGLLEIHAHGHVLGYHACDHQPAIWIRPGEFPLAAAASMTADLDRLSEFLDLAAAHTGLEREEVFSPLFRQPFGGAAVGRVPGMLAAAGNGWIYRGYYIDSGDWLGHADAPDLSALPLWNGEEREHADLVVRRLRRGVQRWVSDGRSAVTGRTPDVLMHVNALTASHLQEWIDVLREEFTGRQGMPPSFTVPTAYLQQSDPIVDISILEELPALSAPQRRS